MALTIARRNEVEEQMRSKRMVEVGDKIRAKGITCTIAKIYYKERYVEPIHIYNEEKHEYEMGDDYKIFYDIEFEDTNGVYRHWKSAFDGGEVIYHN